ncbi:SEL1-like repeat protein [Asticcacaulis biprosthecium]|nr:SEL1-like repeat protein [Asticcacaulis biprosthecium]
MSANAPWSVKGIDAKAREVAKDLARRSGMTLGEWLNQMILQGEDVGALISQERDRHERPVPAAARPAPRRIPEAAYDEEEVYDDYEDDERFAPRTRRPAQVYREAVYADAAPRVKRPEPRVEPRAAYAPRSQTAQPHAAQPQTEQHMSSRDLRRSSIFADRPRADTYEDQNYATASDDLGRVARALEGLGSRIESSESRSATAVRSVSSAVESLLGRLERSEAALEAVAAQTREELHGRLDEQSQEVLSSFEQLARRSEEDRRRSEEDRRRIEEDRLRLEEDRRRTEQDNELFVDRLEKAERQIGAQAERLEGLSGHVREERERMAKIEAGLKNNQTIETVKAVESALGKLANQLYEGDVRTRETVKDIRTDMVTLSHRLAQMETRDPERAAQGVIDKVVSRMAERLEAAEAQTSGAIKTLETAFRNLEGRLSRAEERGDVSDPEAARSLTQLAAELSRRVEENRQELLGVLNAPNRDGVEAVAARFEARLEQVERRQAAALERMGQEIVRMAGTFDRRVKSVEEANSAGLTRLGVEVTRVAETVETRANRTETSHAQALERLGGEIARISERLTAKLQDTERRTTQVLSGIGQEFEQQRDQSKNDLAERIRQSEERTAKLLEDTRARIDQKLAQVQKQTLLSEAVTKPAPAPARDELPSPFAPAPVTAPAAEIETKPFGQFSGGFEDEAEAPVATPAPLRQAPVADDKVDLTGRLLHSVTDFKPEFDPFEDGDDEDFSAELMNSPLRQRNQPVPAPAPVQDHAPDLDDSDDHDPFADIDMSRKTAPRAAAYAARAAAAPQATVPDFHDDEEDAGVSVSTRDALAAARAAVRASMESDDKPLGGLRAGTSRISAAQARAPKAKTGGESTLMKAFKASSLAVVLVGGGIAGTVAIDQMTKGDKEAPTEETPIVAAVVTPEAAAEDTQNQQNLKARYDLAMQQVTARKPGSVDVLKEVANQGYAPAQYVLGQIYGGDKQYGGLVAPDKNEKRKWIRRAAEGGVTEAMYSLGLQFYNGEGGAQDRSAAAMWFRQAAVRGQPDSQYNLGVLYETGVGAPMSPGESYKWYSLAAQDDSNPRNAAEARKAADRLRAQLSDTQLQRQDAAVASFTPITDDGPPLASSAEPRG